MGFFFVLSFDDLGLIAELQVWIQDRARCVAQWLESGSAHAADQLGPLWLLRHTGFCIRPNSTGSPQQHQHLVTLVGIQSQHARRAKMPEIATRLELLMPTVSQAVMAGSRSDNAIESVDGRFAQRELGSGEVCAREHWSAASDQEAVYPVIVMFLAEIKRALVSPAGKHRMAARSSVGLAQGSKCAR